MAAYPTLIFIYAATRAAAYMAASRDRYAVTRFPAYIALSTTP